MEKLTVTHITLIFVFLSILVFALGVYLGILIAKLRQQSFQTKQLKELYELGKKEQENYYQDSIVTIARASVNQQCELSEACIRIKKLLEYFPDVAARSEFSIIEQMYSDLEGFAYLEDRDKLTTKERFTQDKKRYLLEDKYRPEMDKSLNLLITYFSPKQ